jgi:hypothetical protein
MKNINVIKIGNMVKISLGGKLHQKNCGSPKEADELFRLTLKAKENPTDENINTVRAYLNEKTRVAILAGLENDPETGEVFMAGFNTPLPETLVEIIKDYHENYYPMNALTNFWKLLMLNPDKRVRTDLFDFIKTHDFVLTDNGYMVVYKAVYDKENEMDAEAKMFAEYISRQYLHVKKDWKCSPKKYVVYRNLETDVLDITKKETAEGWDEKEKGVEILGNLSELFDSIFNVEVQEEESLVPEYTDMRTRTFRIVLGEPVKQDRKDCDADYRIDCSNGLHVGATKYVENFADRGTSKILVCYVNPANVVAVPQYDHSKMRVCEYFPFALATYEDGKIDIIEQAYFESDYTDYEVEELERQVALVQAEELPIQRAINAENDEERPMSELLKIIESRLVDIE